MNPLELTTENQFAIAAFKARIKELSKEELIEVAGDLFCQSQWIRQYFIHTMGQDPSKLACLEVSNEGLRNEIFMLRAENEALRKVTSDVLPILRDRRHLEIWNNARLAQERIRILIDFLSKSEASVEASTSIEKQLNALATLIEWALLAVEVCDYCDDSSD